MKKNVCVVVLVVIVLMITSMSGKLTVLTIVVFNDFNVSFAKTYDGIYVALLNNDVYFICKACLKRSKTTAILQAI